MRAIVALMMVVGVGCGSAARPSAPEPIAVARPVAVASDGVPMQIAGDVDQGEGDGDEPARITGEGAVLQARCADERRLRSHESTTSLELFFQKVSDGMVSLYWLDFDGRRVHYADLQPGTQVHSQQTYVTHPWVAVDGDGRCRAIFIPQGAGGAAVTIGAR